MSTFMKIFPSAKEAEKLLLHYQFPQELKTELKHENAHLIHTLSAQIPHDVGYEE